MPKDHLLANFLSQVLGKSVFKIELNSFIGIGLHTEEEMYEKINMSRRQPGTKTSAKTSEEMKN